MTKKEIAKKISEQSGITALLTLEAVQMLFDGIIEKLVEEGRIELRNFGVFEVKRRKARKARNPRTGDKVEVPPKNVVTFKPGKEMEERVRQMANVPDLEDEAEAVGAEAGRGARLKSPPRSARYNPRNSSPPGAPPPPRAAGAARRRPRFPAGGGTAILT